LVNTKPQLQCSFNLEVQEWPTVIIFPTVVIIIKGLKEWWAFVRAHTHTQTQSGSVRVRGNGKKRERHFRLSL